MALSITSSPVQIRCKGVLVDMDGILISSLGIVDRTWTKWALMRGMDPEYVCSLIHGRRATDSMATLRPDLDAEKESEILEDIEVRSEMGLDAGNGPGIRLQPHPWAAGHGQHGHFTARSRCGEGIGDTRGHRSQIRNGP